MEILDLFEEKIQALLAQMQRLQVENEALKEELLTCRLYLDENDSLQKELASCRATIDENKAKIDVLEHASENNVQIRQRIEALLHKVQEALPE